MSRRFCADRFQIVATGEALRGPRLSIDDGQAAGAGTRIQVRVWEQVAACRKTGISVIHVRWHCRAGKLRVRMAAGRKRGGRNVILIVCPVRTRRTAVGATVGEMGVLRQTVIWKSRSSRMRKRLVLWIRISRKMFRVLSLSLCFAAVRSDAGGQPLDGPSSRPDLSLWFQISAARAPQA